MFTKVEGERDELKDMVEMMMEMTMLHGRRDNLSKVRGEVTGPISQD